MDMTSDLGQILGVSIDNNKAKANTEHLKIIFLKTEETCLIPCCISGDPLYVGFDLTIASFDSISEVSMVSVF